LLNFVSCLLICIDSRLSPFGITIVFSLLSASIISWNYSKNWL